jgi:hypothetical protein
MLMVMAAVIFIAVEGLVVVTLYKGYNRNPATIIFNGYTMCLLLTGPAVAALKGYSFAKKIGPLPEEQESYMEKVLHYFLYGVITCYGAAIMLVVALS